jgi:hypothetical protein
MNVVFVLFELSYFANLIKNTLHNTVVGEYCFKIVFYAALGMIFSDK